MTISGRRIGAFAAGLVLTAAAGLATAQSSQQQAAMQQAMQKAEALSQQQIESSHDEAALVRLARLYAAAGDKQRYRWTLKQLTRLVPGSMQLKLQLAASYASDDMKTPAYDILLGMKGLGFGVDLSKAPQFEKIHGTEVWDYIVKSLQANMKTFGEGKKAFDLPAADLMFNALAWDPVHKKFLVGSARDGSIHHADMQGKLGDFIRSDKQNRLWSIMDMAVDARHKRLWVATTSVVYFKGYDTNNANQAALVEFDLASGKFLHRYPLAGSGVYLSSVAVAPDGTVYAADGVNKALYTVHQGKLEEIARNPLLSEIGALAISSDGSKLYLADTQKGVIGFDLKTKKAFGLAYNPDALVLPGIVDMHSYKNTLVVIEPGMQPRRVMRLKLSGDGREVTSAMPLDVANPVFETLGKGAVVGHKIYYIANDQRSKYDQYGMLKEGAVLEPVHVFVSDMDFAWDQRGINTGMKKIPGASPAEGKKMLDAPPDKGRRALPGKKKTDNILMQQGHK